MQPRLTPLSECPCARTVETIGEWWSILILRDALQGLTRFDEFQSSLGIAPNMLTRRLKRLTENGVFERRLYQQRPPRHEYILTQKGRDFFPVVAAMIAFGNKHLAPEGEALRLIERETSRLVTPILVDAETLRPIQPEDVAAVAGPCASPGMHSRLALIASRTSVASTTE